MVVWITGLSGAGKTTLANALLPLLPQPALLLDGDVMRDALSPLGGGFEYDDRKRLAHTYARLCKMLAEQDMTVVCATISMFHEVREWNRCNLPGYFEVYLKATDKILLERDYKQVYQANSGSVGRGKVVGEQIQPEFPQNPDIQFTQPGLTADEMAERIIKILRPR